MHRPNSFIFWIDRWGRAKPSDGSNFEEMQVRINKNPFAEGNARIAYYGKMNSLGGPKNYIYKEFKHVQDKSNVFKRYLQQMEVSAIANYLGIWKDISSIKIDCWIHAGYM